VQEIDPYSDGEFENSIDKEDPTIENVPLPRVHWTTLEIVDEICSCMLEKDKTNDDTAATDEEIKDAIIGFSTLAI
jgi:hypothetical protein